MKKLLTVVLILLNACMLFAGITLENVVTLSSLYEESLFDPYGYNTELNLVYLPVEEQRNLTMLAYHDNGSQTGLVSSELSRFSSGKSTYPLFLNGKLSLNASFFRSKIDLKNNDHFLKFDLNVKSYLNVVFDIVDGAKSIGYDGSFFIGPELSYDDKLVLRTGIHHLSGHYGDEIFDVFENNYHVEHLNDSGNKHFTIDGNKYIYYGLAQYVRDNEFQIGLEYKMPKGFTCYFEYAQPFKTSFVRPFFECPKNHKTATMTDADKTAWTKLAIGEGVWAQANRQEYLDQMLANEAKLADSYVAARIHTGIMWEKSFNQLDVFAGCDLQAHQDGQTLHSYGAYDSSNSWEFEVTAGAGVFFREKHSDHGVGVEVMYHVGRFPLLNFFNNRVNAVYAGVLVK